MRSTPAKNHDSNERSALELDHKFMGNIFAKPIFCFELLLIRANLYKSNDMKTTYVRGTKISRKCEIILETIVIAVSIWFAVTYIRTVTRSFDI